MNAEFHPDWPLRHPHIQSFLASFKPRNRRRRRHPVASASQIHTLDCGDGVRLQGLHTPRIGARGLVVLIHGWEGSHESAYLLSMACTLHDAGYAVFRLNLRDHGGTHHLNEAMFHSARIGEVLGALKAIEKLDGTRPMFVIGFSLGGNFALRLGMQGPAAGVHPALAVGICPAINPEATMRALDQGPRLFHRYFRDKWHKTLEAKNAAWPGRYDFSDLRGSPSFLEITARFAERYTEYGALDRYFAQYTLTPEMLLASPGPLAVITAQDDPVVPYRDFGNIAAQTRMPVLAPRHGGHCGFIENLRLRSWAERRVLELLEPYAAPSHSSRSSALSTP